MLGIVSDIHGNLAGLELSLAHLHRLGATEYMCLGDVVDGGPDNTGAINCLRERSIPCVRGNHDAWNSLRLDYELQDWLTALPNQLMRGDALFTHVSPRQRHERKINDHIEAWNVFEECAAPVIFIGHTHVSDIFTTDSDHPTMAGRLSFTCNTWTPLSPKHRFIISVGAVGYSRDHRKTIRCGLYDSNNSRVQICEIEGPQIL